MIMEEHFPAWYRYRIKISIEIDLAEEGNKKNIDNIFIEEDIGVNDSRKNGPE